MNPKMKRSEKMSAALTDFLYWVEEIAGEKPAYRSGGSGKDGTCDCIGLVIGALRRAGGSWPGIHGSNYAARNETDSLSEIRSPADLSVGELVYKHRRPSGKGYSLPARYRSGSDLNDYYHVGIVMSVKPLKIRHMTSPGMQLDSRLGEWSHHGWCRRVSREERTAGAKAGSAEAVSVILTAVSAMEGHLKSIRDILGKKG